MNFLFAVVLFIFGSLPLYAQVLVEEDAPPAVSYSRSNRIAASALDLRNRNKVGIGFSALGAMGIGGVLLELNFRPDTSLVGGYGGGSHFQSFLLQVKHVFGGTWFAPYVTAGYARWFTSSPSGPIGSTTPSFAGNKFLRGDAKQRGEFQENIVYPGIGMQYMQLSGDFAGTSLFVEVLGLLDINSFVFVPTASTGVLYYF